MIVKEKGLLRLMKEAYKGGGYRVVVAQIEGTEYLYCQGGGWRAGMELGNVPRKVLGLLAEHMGKLPTRGEAFKVQKDTVQREIFDVADDTLMDLVKCMDHWYEHPEVKRSRLVWDGCWVWQCVKNQKVQLVDPGLAAIAEFTKADDVRLEGVQLMIRGTHSFAAIVKAFPDADDRAAISHLEEIAWV